MQSQRIAHERDLAQKERDHAEHVAQFLTDVFKAADPAETLSRDQPIGTVLDNARKRLAGHLGDEPGQRVRMLGVLAGVYASLDDPNTAVNLLDQAQRTIDHAHTVDPRIVLAYDLQRARLMQDRGDRQAQRDYANRALALQRALGDRPGKQWDARVLLADSYADQGMSVALQAMQALLRDLARDPDVSSVDYAREQVRLGQDYAIANATAKAEPLVRQGLKTLEANLPADHPDVLDARKSLADLLDFNLNRPEQGVAIMKDVIARQKRVFGERSSSVANSEITLGMAYMQLHRLDDAVAVTQSGCDIQHQIHTRPHQDLLKCLSTLGNLYELRGGKLDLAATNYAEAARVAAAIDGENSNDALKLRGEVGHIRILQGRFDEADRLLAPIDRQVDPRSPGFRPTDDLLCRRAASTAIATPRPPPPSTESSRCWRRIRTSWTTRLVEKARTCARRSSTRRNAGRRRAACYTNRLASAWSLRGASALSVAVGEHPPPRAVVSVFNEHDTAGNQSQHHGPEPREDAGAGKGEPGPPPSRMASSWPSSTAVTPSPSPVRASTTSISLVGAARMVLPEHPVAGHRRQRRARAPAAATCSVIRTRR